MSKTKTLDDQLTSLRDLYKKIKDEEHISKTQRQEDKVIHLKKEAIKDVQKALFEVLFDELREIDHTSADTTAHYLFTQFKLLKNLLDETILDKTKIAEQIIFIETLCHALDSQQQFLEDQIVDRLIVKLVPPHVTLLKDFETQKTQSIKNIKDLKEKQKSDLRIQTDLLKNAELKNESLEVTVADLEKQKGELLVELDKLRDTEETVDKLTQELAFLETELDDCFKGCQLLEDSVIEPDNRRHSSRIIALQEHNSKLEEIVKAQQEEILNQTQSKDEQEHSYSDLLNETATLKAQLRQALVLRVPQANQQHRLLRAHSFDDLNLAYRMPGGEADDMGLQVVTTLTEIFSRGERNLIPIFTGDLDDKDIEDWLEEAEDIAESNNWNDAQKLRFFPDRLKGEAKQCHNESKLRVRAGSELDPPFSYAVWRADMLERFRNNKDIEQIRQHLATLRQSSDQRTKAFVARLNKLYASVYGKDPAAPENPNPREARLYKAHIELRDAERKKLLLKGLLPKIKTELWSRMTENPTFPELCTTAYLAESIVNQKELAEEKSINSILKDDTVRDKHDALIRQQNDIEFLKQQFEQLTLNKDSPQKEKPLVAAVSQDTRDQSHYPRSGAPYNRSYDHRSRSNSRSRSNGNRYNYRNNRDSSNRSRDRSRSNSRDYSRDGYNNRDYDRQNRQGYRTNRSQYNRDNRYRSPDTRSNNRSYSSNFSRGSNDRYQRDRSTESRYREAQRKVRFDRSANNEQTEQVETRRCFNCDRVGHLAVDCRNRYPAQ